MRVTIEVDLEVPDLDGPPDPEARARFVERVGSRLAYIAVEDYADELGDRQRWDGYGGPFVESARCSHPDLPTQPFITREDIP